MKGLSQSWLRKIPFGGCIPFSHKDQKALGSSCYSVAGQKPGTLFVFVDAIPREVLGIAGNSGDAVG